MKTGTYESRGLRLTYRETGEVDPLLLLHAFPLDGRMWDGQADHLPGRCLIPDLSGFGASNAAPDSNLTTRMSDFAQDAAALLDHLGIERTVLLGLSMGGYAALAFAEAFPGRLRGLILADTRAGADAPEARERRLAVARDVLEKGSGFLPDALVPKLLGAGTQASEPGLVEQVRRWAAEAPPAGVAAAQRGMAERPDRSGVLPRIAVPTLVIVGEEDELTPPAESRSLAAAIPKADLAVLPGAGHLSNLEQPEAFNRAVSGFLARIA
jgi:3-oxoadipate enol-lactonase